VLRVLKPILPREFAGVRASGSENGKMVGRLCKGNVVLVLRCSFVGFWRVINKRNGAVSVDENKGLL